MARLASDLSRITGEPVDFGKVVGELEDLKAEMEKQISALPETPLPGKPVAAELLPSVAAGLLAGLLFAVAGIPGPSPAPLLPAPLYFAARGQPSPHAGIAAASPRDAMLRVGDRQGRFFRVHLGSAQRRDRRALVWRIGGQVVARGVDHWHFPVGARLGGRGEAFLGVSLQGGRFRNQVWIWHLRD